MTTRSPFSDFLCWPTFPRGGLGRIVIPKENIEGTIPPELQGTFIRNGPGLMEVFGSPLRHPIDGDGLVATLTFENGVASFQAKFVQTHSHKEESKEKRMLFVGQMGSTAPTVDRKKGWRDMAHTTAFYWGGKILACHEYTYPHSLHPLTLQTEESFRMGGHFDETRAVCAHYRIDQIKDHLVLVGFKAGVKGDPVLTIVEYDKKWIMQSAVTVHIKDLDYVHDLLVTPHWYIVQMTPFVKISEENTREILKGKEFPGDQFRYEPDHPSRIIFIERHAKGEPKVRQFDDPVHGTHIYHFAWVHEKNADTVDFLACCLRKEFSMYDPTNQWIGSMENPTDVCMYRLEHGKLTRETVHTAISEFPTIHPLRHVGTELRYTYVMTSSKGTLPFDQVIKLDKYGASKVYSADGYCTGEPVFAPRYGDKSTTEGAEDDGWIIAQRISPDTSTAFLLLDARTMELKCVIHMPLSVPLGFHGSWCTKVLRHEHDVSAPASL